MKIKRKIPNKIALGLFLILIILGIWGMNYKFGGFGYTLGGTSFGWGAVPSGWFWLYWLYGISVLVIIVLLVIWLYQQIKSPAKPK